MSASSFVTTSNRSTFTLKNTVFQQKIFILASSTETLALCHNWFCLQREMAVPYRTGSDMPISITRSTFKFILPSIRAERGSSSQNYEAEQTGQIFFLKEECTQRENLCKISEDKKGSSTSDAYQIHRHPWYTADSLLQIQKGTLFLQQWSKIKLP